MTEKFSERLWASFSSDVSFMGLTHGLSALAAFLAIVAFSPGTFESWIGSSSLAVLVMAALVLTGWAYVPDFDNTNSTAESSTGLLGNVLSAIFRGSAKAIQTVIRTKRDDANPNPHRGWWHTIPAALMMGFFGYLATSIPGSISIPNYGKVSFGVFSAILISFFSSHIALSGIFKVPMKKLKKSSIFGELISLVLSLGITIAIFTQMPKGIDYQWLGVAIAAGMIVHVLGDAFTTAGVPIFFPLTYFMHGKFWWTTRLTPIKAGGVVENWLFIPIFVIVIIASSLSILNFF